MNVNEISLRCPNAVTIDSNYYPIVRYARTSEMYERFKSVRSNILCISGPPGVGKSKFGASLAVHLNKDGLRSHYFPEKINHDHLMMYLNDKPREAHAFQDCMVTRRLTTYIEAVHYADNGGFAIVDGPITSDNAFELWNYESGYIDDKHHAIYRSMVSDFGELRCPDFIIYLDCAPTTAVRRLAKRQNLAEITTYTSEYYAKYRQLNMVVVGDMRIATIPYNTDYNIDEQGLLDRDAVYNILDDILNRVYENKGIVEMCDIRNKV